MYWITGELVFKSYMPKTLEKGMLFINTENNTIWELNHNVHPQDVDKFLVEHGAPVEPHILYDDKPFISPEQIGWWDDGPDTDNLVDITVDHLNLIITEHDELIDIQLYGNSEEYDDSIENVLIQDGKAVLSVPSIEEDDDWNEDEWLDDSEG